MVNYIWLLMLVSGVIAGLAQGRMEMVTAAILKGSKEALAVCAGLASIMIFWLGILQIAQDAGLLRKLTRALAPLVKKLFPDVPDDHPALGYILSNISANLFGLGNAATPSGLKAMQELQKLNPSPDKATPAMCTLLALNTSGFTLIPTTMIALRLKHGSADPSEILGPTLLATLCAAFFALCLDGYYRFKYRRLRG